MFGGFAPLPFRLTGGSSEEGVSAGQHARLVADVLAVGRTAPFAVMTVSVANATVSGYIGKNGNGSAYAPTVVRTGTGVATVTFAKSIDDEHEVGYAIGINQARLTPIGTAMVTHELTSANVITIRTFDHAGTATDADVVLKVWASSAWNRAENIGEYGGDLDKSNTETETVPYAWTWYQELGDALGDAYTKQTNTHVHARKLALGRVLGAISRAQEKTIANSVPSTADEKLVDWAKVFRVVYSPNDPSWVVRRAVKTRFTAARGADIFVLRQALQRLLGNLFVDVHLDYGSAIGTPPTNTFWPGINEGPASYDMGGGTWTSPRAHVAVEVASPNDVNDAEFHFLVNVKMFRELNTMLPSWVTFSWFVNSGFQLDISHLDFDALGIE